MRTPLQKGEKVLLVTHTSWIKLIAPILIGVIGWVASFFIGFLEWGWLAAGIPSLVILQALTTNPAKLLGLEKSHGAIKPGMRADIIAVRDNPLEKIETVKDVVFVMRYGKVYKKLT